VTLKHINIGQSLSSHPHRLCVSHFGAKEARAAEDGSRSRGHAKCCRVRVRWHKNEGHGSLHKRTHFSNVSGPIFRAIVEYAC
jgi:hypothetical protein